MRRTAHVDGPLRYDDMATDTIVFLGVAVPALRSVISTSSPASSEPDQPNSVESRSFPGHHTER